MSGKPQFFAMPLRLMSHPGFPEKWRVLACIAYHDRFAGHRKQAGEPHGQGCWATRERISEMTGVSPTNVSHAVTALVAEGFIERLQDTEDRRRWRLHVIYDRDEQIDDAARNIPAEACEATHPVDKSRKVWDQTPNSADATTKGVESDTQLGEIGGDLGQNRWYPVSLTYCDFRGDSPYKKVIDSKRNSAEADTTLVSGKLRRNSAEAGITGGNDVKYAKTISTMVVEHTIPVPDSDEVLSWPSGRIGKWLGKVDKPIQRWLDVCMRWEEGSLDGLSLHQARQWLSSAEQLEELLGSIQSTEEYDSPNGGRARRLVEDVAAYVIDPLRQFLEANEPSQRRMG